MIKANELRIGNWLEDVPPYNGQYFQCRWENIGKAAVGGQQYRPVPLSPDILEKCGFIFGVYSYSDGGQNDAFIKDGGRWVITKLELGGPDDGYGLAWFPYRQSQNIIPGQIFYLHQLQNLYFALTGTELEVKL